MTYFIPIDRSTFRRNLNYGKTGGSVAGALSFFVEKDAEAWESRGPMAVGHDPIKQALVVSGQWQFVRGPKVPDVKLILCSFSSEKVQIKSHREAVEFTTRTTDRRQWIFTPVPTPVCCKVCGTIVKHTELEGDEDGAMLDRICPNCKTPECCELEFEDPDAVAKQMGYLP